MSTAIPDLREGLHLSSQDVGLLSSGFPFLCIRAIDQRASGGPYQPTQTGVMRYAVIGSYEHHFWISGHMECDVFGMDG